MDRTHLENCMREAIALSYRLSEALKYTDLTSSDAQAQLAGADDHLITIRAILHNRRR